MEKETEYDSRLANLAAAWFQRAKALDVYLQYELTGVMAAPGQAGVLGEIDALVTQAIGRSGAMPERDDRWLNLTVDLQPEVIRLFYASSGSCPVEPAHLAKPGASAQFHQYPDAYDVTVDWRTYDRPEGTAGAP